MISMLAYSCLPSVPTALCCVIEFGQPEGWKTWEMRGRRRIKTEWRTGIEVGRSSVCVIRLYVDREDSQEGCCHNLDLVHAHPPESEHVLFFMWDKCLKLDGWIIQGPLLLMLHRFKFHLMLTNGNSRVVILRTCPACAADSDDIKVWFSQLFWLFCVPCSYAVEAQAGAVNFPAIEGQVREGGKEEVGGWNMNRAVECVQKGGRGVRIKEERADKDPESLCFAF